MKNRFEDAVNYYLKQMRYVGFVTASERLERQYKDIRVDVEQHCLKNRLTFRAADGRVFLTEQSKGKRR